MVNRLDQLLEEGKTEAVDDFAYVRLDDAKYLVAKSDGDVNVRYHHDKGLSREDVEDIDAIQIGEDGDPIAFDVEPYLGIDSADIPPGTAAMLLDAACRYEAMLESGQVRRSMDFRYIAEDYFEQGTDLVTYSPPDGSDTEEIALQVEGNGADRYTLEIPLESATRRMNDDGTSSPAYERLLVFEGQVE